VKNGDSSPNSSGRLMEWPVQCAQCHAIILDEVVIIPDRFDDPFFNDGITSGVIYGSSGSDPTSYEYDPELVAFLNYDRWDQTEPRDDWNRLTECVKDFLDSTLTI
jgi:hypothetical protein